MKKVLLVLCMVITAVSLLSGCGGSPSEENEVKGSTESNYTFQYNGVTVRMNEKADAIITALGEYKDKTKSQSCAFGGSDYIYRYNGFELSTYEYNNVNYIYYVLLLDDSVSTPENIYIGSSLADVKAKYGEATTVSNANYTYVSGGCKIQFTFENDLVTGLQYFAITE